MQSLRASPAAAAVLMLAILAGGAVFRLADLANRPMHCDEAVHGIKFGRLLEEDSYVYNPREYHGPSLNYLTLPIAWAAGAERVTEVTETQLRLVPAVLGILLIGLPWLLRRELGLTAMLGAAVLTALSTAMVFFSRYYIQEMLLVAFTLLAIAAMWRWARFLDGSNEDGSGSATENRPCEPANDCAARAETIPRDANTGMESGTVGRLRAIRAGFWLFVLGAAIAMMHASKETCVLALAAMAAAGVLTLPGFWRAGWKRCVFSVLLVVLVAAAVSAVFFSSFGKNPSGIVDSYSTYFHYLGQASGEGSVGRHVQPWHYYFRNLFWWPAGSRGFWSEGFIAVLALVGMTAAAAGKGLDPRQRRFALFLSIYTVLLTLIYSVLPYKTPWCSLSFLSSMILLAGIGAAALLRSLPGVVLKTLGGVVLAAFSAHLGWQAYQASFVFYEHPRNPYVYSHTTDDVPMLVERIRQVAAHHPDGTAMYVQAICPDHDYWPLPWCLRDFSTVAWLDTIPGGPPALLIITQPEMEKELLRYLYMAQPPGQRHLYVPLPPPEGREEWLFRPNVPIRVYVQLRLWEACRAMGEE